jgi:hypothetical protein
VSLALHRHARLGAVIAVSALALSLSLTTAPAHADGAGSTIPKRLDVPPDHPWREDTRLALATAAALPGTNAAAARKMAISNLVMSTPAPIRQYVAVGSLHGNRFTITVVGDQACAIWPTGGDHRAEPGPCTAADRIRLAHPAAAVADFLTFAYDDSLSEVRNHTDRVQMLGLLYARRTLANVAWTYAPRGVGVAGVIDKNHDGLDDDARITVHGNGTAVCLRLAVYPKQHSSYRTGICKNLSPRRINYPPGAAH